MLYPEYPQHTPKEPNPKCFQPFTGCLCQGLGLQHWEYIATSHCYLCQAQIVILEDLPNLYLYNCLKSVLQLEPNAY